MVDRQYDLMRRPRMIDDMNSGAKNAVRPDDVEMQTDNDQHQQPAPITATAAQITEHEVHSFGCRFRFTLSIHFFKLDLYVGSLLVLSLFFNFINKTITPKNIVEYNIN